MANHVVDNNLLGVSSVWDDRVLSVPAKVRLTVSDVERMAKAGVKIDLDQIKDQIMPDPKQHNIVFGQVDSFGLISEFLRRWDRAKPGGVMPAVDMYGRRGPEIDTHRFHHVSITSAPDNEGGVHVFVVTANGKAAHLTDEPQSFPSEALMAKLVFLFKEAGA